MEELQKFARNISKVSTWGTSFPLSLSETPHSPSGSGGVTAAISSSDQSRVLITRPPRQMVSLLTCSKLCAFFFAAGIVVGYTLKRSVRRWASKLLKRLKDD